MLSTTINLKLYNQSSCCARSVFRVPCFLNLSCAILSFQLLAKEKHRTVVQSVTISFSSSKLYASYLGGIREARRSQRDNMALLFRTLDIISCYPCTEWHSALVMLEQHAVQALLLLNSHLPRLQ